MPKKQKLQAIYKNPDEMDQDELSYGEVEAMYTVTSDDVFRADEGSFAAALVNLIRAHDDTLSNGLIPAEVQASLMINADLSHIHVGSTIQVLAAKMYGAKDSEHTVPKDAH